MVEAKKKRQTARNCCPIFRLVREKHDIVIDNQYREYYEDSAAKLKTEFQKSEFWVEINENLPTFNEEYQVENGYPLFNSGFKPEVSL